MEYWVAYLRPEADKRELESLGFVLPRPLILDYGFLVVGSEKEKIVGRQGELGVIFLTNSSGVLYRVSEEEVNKTMAEVGVRLKKGCAVVVMEGPYQNMEGVIFDDPNLEVVTVQLKGLTRLYSVTLKRSQVALVKEELITPTPVGIEEHENPID